MYECSLSLQARNTCCPPAQHTTCSQHSLPWTDRSESLGQVNHFLKDKSEEQEMNKPDDDNEKVGDENIQVFMIMMMLWVYDIHDAVLSCIIAQEGLY